MPCGRISWSGLVAVVRGDDLWQRAATRLATSRVNRRVHDRLACILLRPVPLRKDKPKGIEIIWTIEWLSRKSGFVSQGEHQVLFLRENTCLYSWLVVSDAGSSHAVFQALGVTCSRPTCAASIILGTSGHCPIFCRSIYLLCHKIKTTNKIGIHSHFSDVYYRWSDNRFISLVGSPRRSKFNSRTCDALYIVQPCS